MTDMRHMPHAPGTHRPNVSNKKRYPPEYYKLTKADREHMKAWRLAGFSYAAIGHAYEVSAGHAWKVINES